MSLIKLNKNNKWVVITTIHVLIKEHGRGEISRATEIRCMRESRREEGKARETGQERKRHERARGE